MAAQIERLLKMLNAYARNVDPETLGLPDMTKKWHYDDMAGMVCEYLNSIPGASILEDMKWSKDVPTVPGLYWFRGTWFFEQVVRLARGGWDADVLQVYLKNQKEPLNVAQLEDAEWGPKVQ